MNNAPIRMQSLLRELPLFEGMDPTALERMASGAIQVDTPSRTVIFRRGDVCRGLYVVLSG